MNILKQTLSYLIWTLVSFIVALVYMRIILGPQPEASNLLMLIFHLSYEYAFIHIGAIIGFIIAFLFILLDKFYLIKKLKNNGKGTLIRFFVILLISSLVGIIHYILEKVIDVI